MNTSIFTVDRAKQWAIPLLLCAAGILCLWRGLTPAVEPSPRSTPLNTVAFDPAEETEILPQAIETIRVGQRMWVEGNPTGERDERFGEEVVQADWGKMVLRCPERDGSTAKVEMLRPNWWLEERDVNPGGKVNIDVPECGISGLADVLALRPCPAIDPGPCRTVTATFHHQSAATIDVAIEGIDEPIGTTANHPFWSETDQSFVRADALEPGDEVRTRFGTALVTSITPRGPPEPVYNLEVHVDHVYHIAQAGVLVHNSWDDCDELVDLFHGSPDFRGDKFDLEHAASSRRDFHETSDDIAIFLTDDAARAATQYAGGPSGQVVRSQVPRSLADKLRQTDKYGNVEFKATSPEDIGALNEQFEILSQPDAIRRWWLGRE